MSRTRSQPFTFASAGDRLIGVLHLPPEQPVAAVVATGPLTSVKEQATGSTRRRWRSVASLRSPSTTGLGESEGEPRQFQSPEGKADDVRAAVTALVG
jgi:fermentation-respiration switch protein FrsA (DUF1100 family)